MRGILTYEAWLDAVCRVCNNLLKANVSIVGNEFRVAASKYRWVIFISCDMIKHVYDKGWEPSWGVTELMKIIIIEQWDMLLVEEDNI